MATAPETLGFIKPELPTLVPEPPAGEGWIHEIKYDGYRTLIVIDRGQVRAFTRNGNDWTRAYRRVVEACGKLACETALIDGEMVVQDEHGLTDFHALRSAIYTTPQRIVLFAFDLLHLNGKDLRGCPLLERRALLRKLIKSDKRSPIQFSDHLEGDGAKFFKAAADLGLEGIVSKRASSRYRSGRSRSRLKTKNMVESEFILLGTERDLDGVPWALLASERDGRLAFAWDSFTLGLLYRCMLFWVPSRPPGHRAWEGTGTGWMLLRQMSAERGGHLAFTGIALDCIDVRWIV